MDYFTGKTLFDQLDRIEAGPTAPLARIETAQSVMLLMMELILDAVDTTEDDAIAGRLLADANKISAACDTIDSIADTLYTL